MKTSMMIMVAGVAAVANAASVSYNSQLNGLSVGFAATGTLGAALGTAVSGSPQTSYSGTVYMGSMSWDLSGLGLPSSAVVFCTEMTQFVSAPSTYTDYTQVSPTAVPNPPVPGTLTTASAAAIARAFEHYTITTNVQAAAFQAAIWEALYEGLDMMDHRNGELEFINTNTSANFGQNSAFGMAFTAVKNIMLDTSLVVTGTLYAASSPTNQDILGFLKDGGAAVPLPSAGLLGAAGLGLVGLRRRR